MRTQLIRVLPELQSQIIAADSGKPRIIIYLIGGKHLAAADHSLLNHKRVQTGSLGIYGSSETSRSGADYNKIIYMGHI